MKCKTIAGHRASTDDPIEFQRGDQLIVGEEYIGNPGWIDWIKCAHPGTGRTGWVPKQLLAIDGDRCTALVDYTASELTVDKGASVEVQKEMNGWSWCRTEHGEEGWLPNEVLKRKN